MLLEILLLPKSCSGSPGGGLCSFRYCVCQCLILDLQAEVCAPSDTVFAQILFWISRRWSVLHCVLFLPISCSGSPSGGLFSFRYCFCQSLVLDLQAELCTRSDTVFAKALFWISRQRSVLLQILCLPMFCSGSPGGGLYSFRYCFCQSLVLDLQTEVCAPSGTVFANVLFWISRRRSVLLQILFLPMFCSGSPGGSLCCIMYCFCQYLVLDHQGRLCVLL